MSARVRQFALLAIAGAATAAWLLDTLRGGAAQQARAAATVAPPPQLTAKLRDVEPLVREFRTPPAQPAEAESWMSRDLFALPTVAAAKLVEQKDASDATPDGTPPAPSPPVAFGDRHRLEGVMTGRRRMAVIDGRVYSIGALIDGYRIVRIERDFVLLKGPHGPERLLVPPRSQAPAP